MRGIAIGLAGVVGLVIGGTSCLLDLEHALACGDGYLDREAGEECDPADSASYVGQCDAFGAAKDGVCDDEDCTLSCSVCGDGNVDDTTEECDLGRGPIKAKTEPRDCIGLDEPHSYRPYTSGRTDTCLADCTYDRTDCGFCHNNKLEGEVLVSNSSLQPDLRSEAEACDDTKIDYAAAAETSAGCSDPGAVPNVLCDDTCHGFIELDPPCCLKAGSECPADGDPLRCCHEYLQPNAESHCGGQITAEEGGEPPASDPGPLDTCL